MILGGDILSYARPAGARTRTHCGQNNYQRNQIFAKQTGRSAPIDKLHGFDWVLSVISSKQQKLTELFPIISKAKHQPPVLLLPKGATDVGSSCDQ